LDASSYAFDLAVLAALLLFSAFFSGSETALFSANRLRLRHLNEEGNGRARVALSLLERPARLLSTLLVGNNIANTAAAVVATATLVRLLGPGEGSIYAFALVTILLLIFAEVTPKTMAARHADRLSLAVARPIQWASVALSPVIRVLSWLANLLVRPFGGHVHPDGPLVTEEEIQLLVRMGEEQGVLEKDEREMIRSIFEFGDTVVREVMVPRVDMVAVEADESIEAILDVVRTHGHSRIPVYHETIDQIVGLVHVKDLLSGSRDGRLEGTIRDFTRPAYFVPDTKRLDELFREMRRKKVHMAIAVDEYGGTAGLVTIEDLLEEIVGPIQDEYDTEEAPIKKLNDRVALIDGAVHVEEVNAALGLALPAGEVDSVGGFVTSLLGHVPAQGDRITFENIEFSVERVDGHRIAQVRITRADPAAAVDN
jgi:CBS domain containing-hemolysin-like protein